MLPEKREGWVSLRKVGRKGTVNEGRKEGQTERTDGRTEEEKSQYCHCMLMRQQLLLPVALRVVVIVAVVFVMVLRVEIVLLVVVNDAWRREW